MKIKKGDVVFIEKDSIKSGNSKKRKLLLVFESNNEDLLVVPITSVFDGRNGIVLPSNCLERGKFKKEILVRTDKIFYISSKHCKPIASLKKEFFERVFRKVIHFFTEKYYLHFHQQNSDFIPGKMRINYAGRVYDEKELINLVDSALDFWLTASKYDKDFCKKFSSFIGSEYVLTCNSGSSANLLAVSSLTSPKLGELKLNPGDEVITVACGFLTTVAPIFQNNLVPVFVDIELGTYNIDPKRIEEAISSKTKAIFIAHTLGIPFNLDKVLEIAEKYNLWVIEDNCDALGARYRLKRTYKLINGKEVSGERYTGTFGHIGTSSFYPPHHMTMGEGGAVYTDDLNLYRILLSFRDWGRDCWCEPGKDDSCGRRFSWKLGKLPAGYDHKYTYSHLGYNLKITDMQAAVGVAQIEKLDEFIKARQKNWQKLYDGLKDLEEFFVLPRYPERAIPSPFGFVLTIKDEAPFSRKEIVSFLEEKGIQTRMVFAGNIIRQPALVDGDYKYRVIGELKNTDKVMMDTFWIGVYPGLTDEMIEYMIDCIKDFCKRL